jgi:hypothetical protein
VFLGNGGTSGGSESHGGFESIIDPPLETSEGTNHEDSGTESSPESSHSDLSINLFDVLSEGGVRLDIVQFGDPSIKKAT